MAKKRSAPTAPGAAPSTQPDPSPPGPDPTNQLIFLTSAAELGPAIRAARLRLGLTERAAAQQLGVGRRFLFELERGKPSVRLDKTLQVMLGVGLVGVIVPAAALQGG